jgi:hypothetical protein
MAHQLLLRRLASRSTLRSSLSQPRYVVSYSMSTNFEELLVQLEAAEDTHTIQSLVSTALEYESPNIHEAAYESAHVASYKQKNWEVSLKLLNDMEKRRLFPSARVFSLVAQTCAAKNKWGEAAQVVRKAWASDVNVDPKCISSVLTACQSSKGTHGASERSAICHEFLDKTPPELRDTSMARSAMECVIENGSWSDGYDLIKKLENDSNKTQDNVIVSAYVTLMIHCVETNSVEKSLELFHEVGLMKSSFVFCSITLHF